MGVARFAKGSIEAKEYMATIREKARLNREAIANGDLEKIDKPKREKKTKKVKEAVIFKEKEEEVIVSEEEEPESQPLLPLPKQFTKKPKGVTTPQSEPKGVEPEPEVEQEPIKKTKVVKPAKIAEDKPIVVKVPPKKVKKIIIQEEEEEQYEVEYRKAAPKKLPAVKKEVVNNIKDTPIDNPLLGSRVYRNR